jgi:hypothetical protein
LRSPWLVPLLGAPKCDPSENRERDGVSALGGCCLDVKRNNQPKVGVSSERPEDGTPCKKAQGREAQFLFRLDHEKAYAAQSAKANPPPSPPSTMTQTTGPTSRSTTTTERRRHPRRPPRVGTASRLQALTRTTWMMTRSQALAPSLGSRCCPGQSWHETWRRRRGDVPGR